MGRALGLVTLGYPLRRGKSAGAAAFSPSDLDNLALWLKADAGLLQSSGGAAASADGDPVGQWQDQSGNSRHVTAASSARPVVKLSIQNSLPVVRFDGVDDYMESAAYSRAQPLTVFAVVKGASTRYLAGTNTNLRAGAAAGQLNNFAGTTLQGGTSPSAAFSVITSLFNGASSVIRKDGVQAVAGNVGAASLGTAVMVGAGGNNPPVIQFWSGDIAELIVVAGDATADFANVEAYLADYWGL